MIRESFFGHVQVGTHWLAQGRERCAVVGTPVRELRAFEVNTSKKKHFARCMHVQGTRDIVASDFVACPRGSRAVDLADFLLEKKFWKSIDTGKNRD